MYFCISLNSSKKVKVRRVTVNIQRCRWVFKCEKPSSVECTLLLELTLTTQALCASRIRCARGSLLPTWPRRLPRHPWWHHRWCERHSMLALCLWSQFTFIAVGGFFFPSGWLAGQWMRTVAFWFSFITLFNCLMLMRNTTDQYLFIFSFTVYVSIKYDHSK